MITVEVNNGAAVLEIDYTDGMTLQDLILKIQDFKPGQHLRFRSIEIYDPSQNRHLSGLTTEIVDERRYTASAWVHHIVDDSGEKVTEGLV